MPATLIAEMGELQTSRCSGDRIVANGLGACIGVCLYDPSARAGAIAHVVLPSKAALPPTGLRRTSFATSPPAKYADTAIAAAIESLMELGAQQSRLRAAIVGGSRIFAVTAGTQTASDSLEFGPRNVRAVKEALAVADIPLMADDTGGHSGRTVTLEVDHGIIVVRLIGGADRHLATLSQEIADQPGSAMKVGG